MSTNNGLNTYFLASLLFLLTAIISAVQEQTGTGITFFILSVVTFIVGRRKQKNKANNNADS